jgi:hypothetical protein
MMMLANETLNKSILDYSAVGKPANAVCVCRAKSGAYTARSWQCIRAPREALTDSAFS